MITELTPNSVSILTIVNGVNHRRAYSNNMRGREALQTEQSAELVEKIMSVWGPKPTIEETPLPIAESAGPTLEERMRNQEQATLALMDTILMMTGGNMNV